MLDPARLRVDLLVLELMEADNTAAVVEDHEASAGGTLIDCTYVLSHVKGPPLVLGLQPLCCGGR
jgi:hypothetical protein